MAKAPGRQYVSREICVQTLSDVSSRRLRIVRRLLRWARSHGRDFPWRDPNRSSYEVMIAELLLKRTTSTAAARIYPTFVERYPSFSSLADAPADDLEDSLRPVGLYRQRAAGLKQLADHVQDEFDGELPRSVVLLEAIPHAGPYAARAVTSFAHNAKAAVVDSNVIRVLGRLFANTLAGSTSLAAYQEVADALVPVRLHRLFNYALLDLGAMVCRYDRPRCGECPLSPVCDTAISH